MQLAFRIAGWFGLVSVIIISLFGFGWYITFLSFLVFFVVGIITVLYYNYDSKKILVNLNDLDDPLQQTDYNIKLSKVIELFDKDTNLPKFDSRITGSEIVDTFINEIIAIIVNDYVTPWYEILTDDVEFTTHAINQLVVATGANLANRIKCVEWTDILSTRFPEEFTTHLKLFKQSRVRLKHIQLQNSKDVTNGNMRPSPKKEEKKTHRRNKSDTDLPWGLDGQTFGKSKFYDSAENIDGKSLTDLFFDLECSMENKQICRDSFCIDSEREYALLNEVSEAVLYLITPEATWKCHALKLILIDLLSSIVLRPIMNLLSDPDNINRAIIKSCVRDSTLSSELFLLVIRSCGDAEELDATLELVQKDIQKLHSKDSAGEWELQDRQKLSSLRYLTRIIQARRATLGPQEGSSTTNTEKVSEEVSRTLKFLRETTAWRSNAQYLLEIEVNDDDAPYTSKAVLDNLRSSALELCDSYLAPNKPTVMGIPENCYSELVRKITMEGEEFTNNPAACFDDVQKCVCVALEDDPSWQSDFMMDTEDNADRNYSDLKKDDKPDNRKYGGDVLPLPTSRHNRSRSDIVGNFAQKMINEGAGPSSLISANTSNLSLSHSEISKNAKNMMSPLSACIIETALVQEKGRTFGTYAIAVTRLSDNAVWHIYRRYSDFYDLHTSIKEKWSELGNLPFPAKKTFQNTSRAVLESRKKILNSYLQKLANLAQETRYTALLSEEYLGGFLSEEIQAEKHNNTIDALFVNPLKAGMRTLKNMPDQFVNTVDGVMDGISKVFQGKSDNYSDNLKSGSSSEGQEDGDESVALRLLEEVLGIRGLWLRRRLLAPLRTLISDRVDKKVRELVTSLTSPRNVVKYLKKFKQWLTQRNNVSYVTRDSATKARTRVAAKVALLGACTDDLRHIAGSDTARRGLLTVFDLFQTQEINRRLILVLLEAILTNLFPDNNIQDLFKKLYSNSSRVPVPKKSVNI
ncbi:sorting nexin-13-like isoform X2 [Galleria mellonella]|uniref:Sorting nexin-13-like isoform X2 n=1 Tax=Galleria mellonella TaxID=7137 RepID=A0ABM3MHJ4_GALME|nr:sorting nexin-13-like isoform X2 [Galleria mellonella]